jgi:F-type H+-transporting ATPase subunit a
MEHEAGIHVAIAAEKLGEWFGIPITNTLLMSWFVVIVLGGLAFFVYRRTSLIPGRLQSLFELLVEGILKFMEDTLESKELARKYFPLIVTIFIFVFVGNLMEFIPGVGPIGMWHVAEDGSRELVPLFRSMNTDLNMTLALAIISFLTIEISGIVVIGFFKYFSRFFNFHSFIGFIVGIIEFVSEMIRLVSFSFRLFGNIFAGEVLLAVIAFFVPVLMPVPFMAFELFVGFMQAGIFAVLTLFFLKLAVTEPAH